SGHAHEGAAGSSGPDARRGGALHRNRPRHGRSLGRARPQAASAGHDRKRRGGPRRAAPRSAPRPACAGAPRPRAPRRAVCDAGQEVARCGNARSHWAMPRAGRATQLLIVSNNSPRRHQAAAFEAAYWKAMSNISPLRVWAVTPSGSYVLPDVGLVIRTTEGNWRAYTIENLGE